MLSNPYSFFPSTLDSIAGLSMQSLSSLFGSARNANLLLRGIGQDVMERVSTRRAMMQRMNEDEEDLGFRMVDWLIYEPWNPRSKQGRGTRRKHYTDGSLLTLLSSAEMTDWRWLFPSPQICSPAPQRHLSLGFGSCIGDVGR